MNNFKFIKRGMTYIPIQVTSSTGTIIELYVDEASFNSGAPADVFTFEELRDLDGYLRVILIKEDR